MSVEIAGLKLLQFLSTKEHCSGEDIARVLGYSRSAVWKQVEALRNLGVPVLAVAGKGYRLEAPVELLDTAAIERSLPDGEKVHLNSIEVLPVVDSTNAELKRRAYSNPHGVALLAERQTAGRGRHGRAWFSPLARNIYCSLGWRFEIGVAELAPLPLLLALAASDALSALGHASHAIKWPNDLLSGGQKLGGCLVEVQGDANGPCDAILGVGINVRMPPGTDGSETIDQPWTDVASEVPDISRNRLAAALLSAMISHLLRFERLGFEGFLEAWRCRDGLEGQEVTVSGPAGRIRGIARGVSARGGLRVETSAGVREFFAGEVSLRV